MNETCTPEELLAADVADIIRCTALSLLAVQDETGHTDTDLAATFATEAWRGLGAAANAYSAPVHAMAAAVTRVFLQAAAFDTVVAETTALVTRSAVRRTSAKMAAAATETTVAHLMASLDFELLASTTELND